MTELDARHLGQSFEYDFFSVPSFFIPLLFYISTKTKFKSAEELKGSYRDLLFVSLSPNIILISFAANLRMNAISGSGWNLSKIVHTAKRKCM